VNVEKDYDCVIFGGAGNILGDPRETLNKLLKTIIPKGFILIDEAFLPDGSNKDDNKYKNYEYLRHEQWMRLFKDCNLNLVEEAPVIEDRNFDSDNRAIAARAEELTAKYPEKSKIFKNYVQSQLNECADLENNIVAVTWMLQKL
jgi:hypothetical protein